MPSTAGGGNRPPPRADHTVAYIVGAVAIAAIAAATIVLLDRSGTGQTIQLVTLLVAAITALGASPLLVKVFQTQTQAKEGNEKADVTHEKLDEIAHSVNGELSERIKQAVREALDERKAR